MVQELAVKIFPSTLFHSVIVLNVKDFERAIFLNLGILSLWLYNVCLVVIYIYEPVRVVFCIFSVPMSEKSTALNFIL